MSSYKVLVFMFLCLLVQNTSGQEIYYSEYENFDFRSGDFDVVGKVGDLVYVYRSGSDGFFLDAYDDKMKRQAKVILDFLPKRIYKKSFITYSNKLIFLYQTIEDGDLKQYVAVLDDKGFLKVNPKVVFKDDTGLFGIKNNLYNYAVSDDKESILIYGLSVKGATVRMKGVWIDADCNVQSTSNVTYTVDNNIANGQIVINNEGEIFLPVYTPVGTRQYADRLWLLSLPQGGTSFTASELALNNMFASGTFMELDNKNDRIYIGGFYAEKKNGYFLGVTYTYYDIKTKKFIPLQLIPFSDRLLIASGNKNKKRAFDDYRLKKLVVKNNGGFVLMAERYYTATRSSYTPGFGYYSSYFQSAAASVTEYNYGDILTISYSGDGATEWYGFVRKNQYSYDDGGLFSSFSVVNTGGALGILYNDFNTSRSRVQLASVGGNGDITTRTLSKLTATEPDWLPKSGKQVSSRAIVIPCLYKKDVCFVKVEF